MKIKRNKVLLASLSGLLLSGSQIIDISPRIAANVTTNTAKTCQSASQTTDFLVIAGGGNPESNEIALEKNVLYFQRSLKALGYNPANASVWSIKLHRRIRIIRSFSILPATAFLML